MAYFPKVIPKVFWQQKREGRFTKHIKPTKHLGGLPFKMIFRPASLEVVIFRKGTPFLTENSRNPVFSPGFRQGLNYDNRSNL